MTEEYGIGYGLHQFLSDLGFTAAVYRRELPENPSYPATVVDVIDDFPVQHTYDAKVMPLRRARVTIEVIGEDVEEVEDLMEKYLVLLCNFKGSLGIGYTDVSIFDLGSNPDLAFEGEPTLRHLEGRSRDFKVVF